MSRTSSAFGANYRKWILDEGHKRVNVGSTVYAIEEYLVAVYVGKDNRMIVKAIVHGVGFAIIFLHCLQRKVL